VLRDAAGLHDAAVAEKAAAQVDFMLGEYVGGIAEGNEPGRGARLAAATTVDVLGLVAPSVGQGVIEGVVAPGLAQVAQADEADEAGVGSAGWVV
jgi:TctA family transporter